MLRPVLAAVCLLALAACDSGTGNAQQLFEDRALLDAPSGVNDEGDWQVGPAFTVRVSVIQPVTPNPVGATETAVLTLDAKDIPTGLTLYRQDTDGRLLPLGSPGTFFDSAAAADFLSLPISSARAATSWVLVIGFAEGVAILGVSSFPVGLLF